MRKELRMVAPALVSIVLTASGFAAEGVKRTGNLIDNPGFEDPAGKSWRLNNWFKGPHGEKSVAEAALDAANPHSGKQCLRVSVSKHVGQDVQLHYRLPTLVPGALYELRFFIRGTANTAPVKVLLLRQTAPYTKYMIGQVSCTENWTEVLLRAVLPPSAVANQTGLWISLWDEGTIWLDDFSFQMLPPVEGGPPLAGNLIANGSFEVGCDKWYASIHGPGGRYERAADVREEIVAKNMSNFDIAGLPDAPGGKKAFHWHNTKLTGINLTSAKFRLRYGRPVTVKFSARTGPKAIASGRNMWFMLASGEYGAVAIQGKRECIPLPGNQWHSFTYHFMPKPSADGRYFLEFMPAGWDADFWIDAVSVTEDAAVAEVSKPPAVFDVGWETIDDALPGNIFHPGEKVAFRVLAHAPGEGAQATLDGRVVDAWENTIARIPVKVPLTDARGAATVELPSSRFGAFKCEFYSPQRPESPAAEIVYHIVPRLTPLKQAPDSFFGGHVDLTPYNLAIAEKAGFRWLRYHGPADTKWRAVQPTAPRDGDDGFVFHHASGNWLAGTKRAHEMGFRIFGTFGKAPPWAEDKADPKASSNGYASYPPADYAAWEKYIVQTVKAFHPYITTWEVWNEPDAGFLHTDPGKSKEMFSGL